MPLQKSTAQNGPILEKITGQVLAEKCMTPSSEVLRRRKEINEVVLTEEEKERALYNAKIQKWNEQENADYWAEQEAKRPNQAGKEVGKIN